MEPSQQPAHEISSMQLFKLLSAFCVFFACSNLASAQQADPSSPLKQPSIPDGWSEVPFAEQATPPQLNEAERSRGYMLFQRSIMDAVYPNSIPREFERLEVLSAFATPGELETLNLAVYPVRDLKNMSVSCSDLLFNRERIPASAVDVRLVTYWNMRYPMYTSDGSYRRVPELLEQVKEYSSPKAECERWWLTVHVPEQAKPGLYEGTVTVRDEGYSQVVEVPVKLRVMNFKLDRDPKKHLSAYYEPRNAILFKDGDKAFVDRATANEYRSMMEHGLDMFPTFSLSMDWTTKRITLRHSEEIQRMQKAGLKGPLPVEGGNAIERILMEVVPGFKHAAHWVVSTDPPPQAYELIEQKFREFRLECEKLGLPEMICCPLDEVASESKEFGSKVYAAVKRAGFRTYATKNPVAPDSLAYAPFVDIWCSQPYSQPFETVIANKDHEYWSYPNHNAGELKDRDIMCKGGRMTYGFGFWRSGYTTLIPWHWAWTMEPDALDYLRSPQSGCGQRVDRRGNVIPSVYWACFREGFDDNRYLYTLQQATWEREGSTDARCQQLVRSAKSGLQQIWDAIRVQDRYLASGMWPSSEFDARRWQMAVMTEQLKRYPAVRKGQAPSVYVEQISQPDKSSKDNTVIDTSLVEQLELASDVSQWKSETIESVLTSDESQKRSAGLRWSVAIDHEAGGEADGKYNVGWPRIRRSFAPKEIDFTMYDFLEIDLQFDSNRDEVQDDVTQLGVAFSSHDAPRLYEVERDLGGSQRQLTHLRLPIRELIQECGKGDAPWKSLDYVQLFISESNYADKVKLTFDVRSIRLVRFKQPQIVSSEVPRVILLPIKNMAIACEVAGLKESVTNEDRLLARIIDKSGQAILQTYTNLLPQCTFAIDTSSLNSGSYTLELAVQNKQGSGSIAKTTFRAIQGPTSDLK